MNNHIYPNKNVTHIPVFFLMIFFLTGCGMENDIKKNENIPDFSFLESWRDTLTINASFDEYGEWGGHTEKLWIYYFDQELFGEFLRDTVEDKKELLDSIPQKIVEHKLFRIGDSDKLIISNFLDSILTYSLKKQNIEHAGRNYNVDFSNLYISFYDYYGASWTPYKNLKKIIYNSKPATLPSYIDRELHIKLFNLKEHQKFSVPYYFSNKTESNMWIDNANIFYGNNDINTEILIEMDSESLLDKENVPIGNLIVLRDSFYFSQENIKAQDNKFIKLKIDGNLFLESKEEKSIVLIRSIYFEIIPKYQPYKLNVNSSKDYGVISFFPPEDNFRENKVLISISKNQIKKVKLY